jgi:hypothetical protein
MHSSLKLVVGVEPAHVDRSIAALVALPSVHAVEHRPLYETLNFNAKWVTQGQTADRADLVGARLGLTGLNEIVGVADTG